MHRIKSILINDTINENHHGCSLVRHAIDLLCSQNNIEIIASFPVGNSWKDNDNIKKLISTADVVLVNGEGTIHHGRSSAEDLLDISEYCKEIGVKSVLINSIYQDNPSRFIEKVNNFDLVYVRDSFSYQALTSSGVNMVKMVPDLSFTAINDIYNDVALNKNSQAICVTDSVYDDVSLSLYEMAKYNKFNYLPIHTPSRIKPYSNLKKLRRIKRVTHNLYNKLEFIFGKLTIKSSRAYYEVTELNNYLALISESTGVISGRFHACCMAIWIGKPFVCIKSNSNKTQALLKDVGLLPSREVNISDAFSFEIKEFSDEEKLAVANFKVEILKKHMNMFEEISSIVVNPNE
ncbi:polysaccharide pyruvyl transferase family protein [Vibrio cyclitrophicus]